jgi:hypothetical protein
VRTCRCVRPARAVANSSSATFIMLRYRERSSLQAQHARIEFCRTSTLAPNRQCHEHNAATLHTTVNSRTDPGIKAMYTFPLPIFCRTAMVGCQGCCDDISCKRHSTTAGADQQLRFSVLEPGAHARSAALRLTCTPGPAIRWCRDEVLQATQCVGHTAPPLSMPRHPGVFKIILYTSPCTQPQGCEVHKACSQGTTHEHRHYASCVYGVMLCNHNMRRPSTIGREAPATAAISFGPRAAPLMLSSRSDVLHAASSANAPP